MSDLVEVTVKRQKVFHDGRSMIVLKPGKKKVGVERRFIAGLVDEGVIDPPKEWEPDAVEAIAKADGTLNAVSNDAADSEAEGAPPA